MAISATDLMILKEKPIKIFKVIIKKDGNTQDKSASNCRTT